MFKRAIILLFLLCLFLPNNTFAVKITIPPASAYTGDSIEVPVNLDHAEALGGFQMTISYNASDLRLTGISRGDLCAPSTWTFVTDASTPGSVRIAAYDGSLAGPPMTSGTLVRLMFNIDGIVGSNVPFNITNITLSDIYGNKIPAAIAPLSIHVYSVDIDGDGLANHEDNCPYHYNPGQADMDSDGIGDGCDNCSGNPIKVGANLYSSLQEAYNAAPGGATIKVQAEVLYQDLTADQNKTITLEGGYDCGFTPGSYVAHTSLKGELHNTGSSLTIRSISFEKVDNGFIDCSNVTNPRLMDRDQDGIVDACDACPENVDQNCDADSDGDGMPDSYEIAHGLNRSDPVDADIDNDGDGLSNLHEYQFGTSLNDPDTDDDGLPDGNEYCSRITDRDGDGVGDPDVPVAECPMDNCPYISNRDQTDTDGDGIGDICDVCPDIADSAQEDADGDGIGDLCDACTDIDFDGYGEPGFSASTCEPDNCPGTYNHSQADTDYDGIGEACDRCPSSLPIRVGSNNYSSLQAAYNAAPNGETIMVQAEILYQDLTADQDKTVTLEGGYDCGFTPGSYLTETRLRGELHNVTSSLTVKTFRFERLNYGIIDCDNITDPNLEDSDNDGTVDACDPCPGNPASSCDMDTDGDEMPDSYEIENGLNRHDADDAGLNKDKDSLTNLDEYLRGFNPADPDSNDDGAPDGRDSCSPVWTDSPISAGVTVIKVAHITELRNAVGNLRVTNSLAPYRWTHYSLTPQSNSIYAEDITDLRIALTDVLVTLGKTVPVWETNPDVVRETTINKEHIDKLRQAVQDACD